MSDTRYKIVFDGALQPEVDITTAKLNLADLFKTDVAAIERLFSGQTVALKRDLSHADAQTYLNELTRTGIHARIEAEVVAAPIAPTSTPVSGSLTLGDESPYSPPRAAVGEALAEYSQLKVFGIQGRIGRLRYLAWSMVALAVIGAVALFLLIAMFSEDMTVLAMVLTAIAVIAYLYVNITISVQRLHDLGWSGWLWLLNLVPFIGGFFPFLLMLLPGNTGPNRYGPPQPPNSTAVKVIASLWLVLIAIVFISGITGGLTTLQEEYESSSIISEESAAPADDTTTDDVEAESPPAAVDYEKE
ncbi:DUF805 domain-containing protein [Pseudomonas sp. SZMC_28357]|uniref:DUF805 domain-containing protein n=1 Tax=Pseudomonas sp. SZMC_28357 TaxID=3074380 RepID=UPI002870B968|nr:DUF805 domain-containing protein [Pseudomonas sp. SZMC_28357]MDR9752010.1 DUF805 domain-containing protein [Pseudomonas sp. SZMC_28357]